VLTPAITVPNRSELCADGWFWLIPRSAPVIIVITSEDPERESSRSGLVARPTSTAQCLAFASGIETPVIRADAGL